MTAARRRSRSAASSLATRPAVVGRGWSLIRLPGEPGFRDLREYELEALLALAVAGEVRFTVPAVPRIGNGPSPCLPSFPLETRRGVRPDDRAYPARAVL